MNDHDKAVRAAALIEAARVAGKFMRKTFDQPTMAAEVEGALWRYADMPPGYVAVERAAWNAFVPFLNWAEDQLEARHGLERQDWDDLQRFYDARAALAEVLK